MYSMKRTFHIPFIAAVAFVVAGCSIDELFNPDQWQGNNNISFSTRMPATRAAAFDETGTPYTTMGVYATVDGTSNLMPANQLVTRTSGGNGWSYTPTVQWPKNDKEVSFYAYAPYVDQSGSTPNPVITQSPGIMPSMNFTVSATAGGKADKQVDLLMAEPRIGKRDSTTTDVQLSMRHMLTRVLFSARTQNSYGIGVSSIQITNIEFIGLKNKGTHDMDATLFWEDVSAGTSDNYTLTSAGGGLLSGTAADLTNSDLKEISTDDGNLYLMPQVPEKTAKLNITVTTVGGSDAGNKLYSFDLIDLVDEFKQGEALRFLLTVPNTAKPEPFQIEVQHGDWNADNNIDASIERNPVLYISNETVYAYDGAVTCIYFSSNIPPHPNDHPTNPNGFNDIIYIEPQGRIASDIGATFSVKDEFYAIAQDDPDRTNITLDYVGPHINNLRYEKDGNTGLFKGHIDIVQRKTTAAGETPNQGKQPLILKLHVGKLVRDITVQRVVTTEAAKQNPTRYVGTFHRHNETGERLVTWHEAESTRWRVEIDNSIGTLGDRNELQLDTRISPDFRNKQLYTLVARDPEGTRVEQNNNLFGRGRVYFRVGWRTPTSATGGKNRYVRVKVSLWKNNAPVTGPVTETHYLYCRQGETEEQIATARSRYALFNVSTPGEFAQYPTQTGMLYQWNRLIPWSPLGILPPYGWNSAPNDYETDFKHEQNACPEGYVYPAKEQFDEMKIVFGAGGTASARGYYADGYFDRRAITYHGAGSNARDEHRVNASNIEVAAIGTILFNGQPGNSFSARSIFLVSGGYRNVDPAYISVETPDGSLLANENHGADHGVHGGYWFNMPGASGEFAKGAVIFQGMTEAFIKDYPKRNAHSIRCIRDESWILVFDANGGENAPRSMTIPPDVTTPANTLADIPVAEPTNYYRDGYEFKGWTLAKDGTGKLFTAGQKGVNLTTEFGAASLPSNRVQLYAKWELH